MCATQHWNGGNPLEKVKTNRAAEPVSGQFLAVFCNQVLP